MLFVENIIYIQHNTTIKDTKSITKSHSNKSKSPSLSESDDDAVIGIPQCTISKTISFVDENQCVSKEIIKGQSIARSVCAKRKMISHMSHPKKLRTIATNNSTNTQTKNKTDNDKNKIKEKNCKRNATNNQNNDKNNNNNNRNANNSHVNTNIIHRSNSNADGIRNDINDLLFDAMNESNDHENDSSNVNDSNNNANDSYNANDSNQNKSNYYVDWFNKTEITTAVVISRELQNIQNILNDKGLSPEIQKQVMDYINALLSGKWAYFINGEVLVLADLDTNTKTINVCYCFSGVFFRKFFFVNCEIA